MSGPLTLKIEAMVEELLEIKPLPTVSIPVVEALVRVVTPVTFKVPVAVIFATLEIFPDKKTFPCTESSWEGEVVPIPNNPPAEVRVLVANPVPRLRSPPLMKTSPVTV